MRVLLAADIWENTCGTCYGNHRTTSSSTVAALGLGVAGMGIKNAETCYELKQVLFCEDSAVAGEAAGFAMGLTILGTADATASEEML